MKNIHWLIHILLSLAVGYLYLHDFNQGEPSGNVASDVSEGPSGQALKIAWVDTDTLVAQYAYHKKLKTQLESKYKRMEEDIARRTDVLKENYEVLQQQAARLSPEQRQQAQQELMQKEQELRMYSNQKAQELAQQEQELNLVIKEDMDTILKGIKKEYQLDFILSYDPNSILLAANPEHEITDIVVKKLNENYAAQEARQESEH